MSTWALVGSPNSGKTTLYNWLTGAKSKTVNYPGATVEYSVGELRKHLSEKINNKSVRIVDTPGVYSLTPQSDDEKVTYRALFEKNDGVEKIDGIIVVADATQLNRHLVLLEQMKQTGYSIILVVTMSDLIKKAGTQLNHVELSKKIGAPVVLFDGILGQGLNELVLEIEAIKFENKKVQPVTWTIEQQSQMLDWADKIEKSVVTHAKNKSTLDFTVSVDRFLLHPFFGFVFFFVFMTLLFASVYWAAQPAMDQIDGFFGMSSEKVTEWFPGLLGDFLGAGLISAIGGVVIFVPQIFILFLGIGVLESTGYLARVAALIDKPLSALGLGGRSFVPVLSGFACSIPAIMATRNITSKKERLIAQSIIPFMTCSARLPVYGLMIGFLFPDGNPLKAGMTLAALYFLAILVGAIASKILSMILKGEKNSRLMMELPLYRRPRFRILFMQALTKSKSFIQKAGPIIAILALILWFGTNFPRTTASGEAIPSAEIASNSYAAQVGKTIEPAFKPLGLDWRGGFALISAFAAREVFVSALALAYNIEGEEEEQTAGLMNAMRESTFPDGTKIFTTATVVGIFIFFTIALQCISTVGILRREAGSWTPAILQLVLSNVVAYILAAGAVALLS